MTIKDIARLSGYGVSTVSRVLNNHPDVSEKAKKEIMKIIEQENYHPNSNARRLKMQGSSALAIIVKGTHNMLFSDLFEQIQRMLFESGESAIVRYIDEDANEVEYALGLCNDRNPKGIIFLGGNLEYFKKGFINIDIPAVLVTNSAEKLGFENLSSITTDDEMASYDVVRKLIELGHKKIGIIGGNLSSAEISYKRYLGCKRAFDEYGIEFSEKEQYKACRFSTDAGYKAVNEMLEAQPDITAIYAMSDVIAVGAMRAIVDMGKKIPEDVSVVGYDGINFAKYSIPRLETVYQNIESMARETVNVILRKINYPEKAVHKVIPFKLIEGDSVTELKK